MFGEVVVGGGGTDKVGRNLRRVADIRRPSRQQLEKFCVVNNLGPFRIDEQWRNGFQRLPFFVVPDGASLTGIRRNLVGGDGRSQPLRFALPSVEMQPPRQWRF